MNENYNIIDKFIIENSKLFDYMGVAVVIFSLFAIFCLICAISLQTKKEKLKSRNKKSAFAKAYIGKLKSSAISNLPIKKDKNSMSTSSIKKEVNNNMQNPIENQTFLDSNSSVFNNKNVIEICFEFNNKYDII